MDLYINNITPKSELEKKEIIRANKNSFKYDGKPSKKDRRALNDYLND